VTSAGIDFIRKVGHGLTNLTSGKSSSIICSFGKYTTGETVEQWLAEGKCEQMTGMEEGFDLFEVVPERSIVELVASRLVKEEDGLSMEDVSVHRILHLFVHGLTLTWLNINVLFIP